MRSRWYCHSWKAGKTVYPAIFFCLLLLLSACATKAPDTLRKYTSEQHMNFGMAVHNSFFSEAGDSEYKQVLKTEFNTLVAENSTKPYAIEPVRGEFEFNKADQLVDFARENGMKMRGHCLVWHKQIPEWMNNDQFSKEELLSILKEYITTVVDHFKGEIFAWDVVNEAIDENEEDHFRQTIWTKVIGPEFIDSAFVWAHQADPSALLFYNDYDAENMNKKSDAIYELVKGLKSRGVPINGVGLQCHFQLGKIDFDGIKENMQRLENLGLQTQITELDISIDKGNESPEVLQKQAEAYGKMAQLWIDDKNCTAFIIWGLTDKYSWIPQFSKNERGSALLYDENFNRKPAYNQILQQLKSYSFNYKPE